MSTCCSKNCKKYMECARACINNEGLHTSTDKANQTFIQRNNNGTYTEGYWCGEKGNYRLFEKVKKHGEQRKN